MTREQKLALIVGFSLVLLVGVLISDHLSRARQAKIASVSSSEAPSSLAGQMPANDPLKALNTALNSPGIADQPPTGPALTAVPSPDPAPRIAEPAPTVPGPTVIAQGRPVLGEDTALKRAVEGAGGMIRLGRDGTPDIILPATAMGQTQQAAPRTLPASSAPAVSPLNGYTVPVRTLATNEPTKTHLIQKGETLFEIASRYYGTGHVWRELAKFNGVSDKNGLVRVGSRLRIPSKDVLLGKTSPVETAGRGAAPITPNERAIPARRQDLPVVKPEIKLATYTVKKGDTLGEISKRVLGSSKRWQELAEFNKLEDEDSITTGTVLKVPPMRG